MVGSSAHRAVALRLLSTLVAAIAVDAAASGTRKLLQSSTTIRGRAIVVHQEFVGGVSGKFLALRTDNGVNVQLANAVVDDASTGQMAEATGTWCQQNNGQGNAFGKFKTESTTVSGNPKTDTVTTTAYAEPPELADVTVGTSSGATATSATLRDATLNVTAFSGAMVTSPLFQPVVSTLFVLTAASRALLPGIRSHLVPEQGRVVTAVTAELERLNIYPTVVTVGSMFQRCTFGGTKLNTSNSAVTAVTTLPCSGTSSEGAWTFSRCEFADMDGTAEAAEAKLRAQGINVDAYFYRVFMLPPGLCAGMVGTGYVGCDGSWPCRAWVGHDFWTSPMTIAHELGHNLYLSHSGSALSGQWDEYDDESCAMGYCCSYCCLNAPKAWQLGWNPVKELGSTAMKPGTTVSTSLFSQSLAIAAAALRVKVSYWVGGEASVYVSYRKRHNTTNHPDAYLPASVADQLVIHTSNVAQPFDPAVSRSRRPGPPPPPLGAVGEAWTHPNAATGLVIRRVPCNLTNRAQVHVCRKGGPETAATCAFNIDNDCNGLSGPEDPACALI
ncbi:hypothetical protein CHLNCDRAFT_138977 [Chlorella variabilis]|uniref:Peptidase M11 gametolysin domain-containing protein n=1 Tax=Chlorella variabilis TaxID=554065 RepID=E1ZP28_CHLVA|nr:hypothetical protein CHLNCDRAFT_138977 [Chlorella variabilis]EFN52442.1 hypothetical protein CHLNCDRAFT_138977 [Chlorella variabilis]|eukprot:XP_005844544.1 hypothetical protein CHLNCDRAFT_138977 [Chlorella variabilis]